MEVMPYSEHVNDVKRTSASPLVKQHAGITSSDWQQQLPILGGHGFTLRELTLEDAPSLFAMLTTEEVSRFISPPPTSVEGFERFIAWTHRQRAAGQYVCFGVVPEGMTVAIGLFQLRSLERGFRSAEWGFAIGSPFWGTGLFATGADLVLDFAFETVGAFRLEARSSTENGRGNGALRKLGAVREGVLRNGLQLRGVNHDQNVWSILASDRQECKVTWEPRAA